MQTTKTVKIGNSLVNETQYRDFFNRYETIEDTDKIESAKSRLKELKAKGYKTKYKTVSFMDLLRDYYITYKAIKLKPEFSKMDYDQDLIENWLKW